jgi:pimeloyl-ACP methyl ester carboxylesterase
MDNLSGMWGRLFRRPPVLHVAGDSGSGPVVVMIHGIASSSVTYQNLVPLLEADHRCILIDLLGFGGSPAPDDSEYRLRDHARSLHRTIRSLKLREPYTLVGHSLGALIAARYAARFRTRIRRLVLVSPPIYLTPRELGDERDRFVQDAYLRAYDYIRTHEDFTVRNAAFVQQVLPIKNAFEITPANWVPFVRSLEQSIESQTAISDLAAVNVPVDVVVGTFDEFSSPGGMRIVERLRGVTVHRVRGAAHLILPALARAVAAVVRSPLQPVP